MTRETSWAPFWYDLKIFGAAQATQMAPGGGKSWVLAVEKKCDGSGEPSLHAISFLNNPPLDLVEYGAVNY